MGRLRIRRIENLSGERGVAVGLLACPKRVIRLETGETLKRGCGRKNLFFDEVGLKCFYCGNYVYLPQPSLGALWFHFKIGREFWKASQRAGVNFINGVPVSGMPDPLPQRLRGDLSEPKPPTWFSHFVNCEEDEFERYLEIHHG